MKNASIEKILDINPIPDADSIEVATVLGWQVVVKKGEFKPGDYCVFVSIDTVVPDRPEFEFLRDRNFRVRTIKLRGQISQGLILPLDVLGAVDDVWNLYMKIEEGLDVSEKLGIVHYEKPLPLELSGMAFGSFPGFLQRTDEVMLQNEPRLLDKLAGRPYYITTKIDGMSTTLFRITERFGVCSRNLELQEHENNVFWQMVHKYGLDKIPEGVYIQGEVAGPGIQKNRLSLAEPYLFIFNIRKIEGNKPFTFKEMLDFLATEEFGRCDMVPIVEAGDYFDYDINQLIWIAGQTKYFNGGPAEGIVVRSQDGLISFKVMNNNYLLKNKE